MGQFYAFANTLSQQPGLAWLGDLTKRQDVDWKTIQLATQKWSEDHGGLTQEGGIVVAIVVAIATWGIGSAAGAAVGAAAETTAVGAATAAGATATTAASVGATAGATAGAMASAAVTTLSTQFTMSLINNEGKLNAAIDETTSDESLKQLAASMLTSGVNAAFPSSGGVSSIVAHTAAGCASGELTGQGCQRGAIVAGTLSSAGVAYRNIVGYDATLASGENRTSITTNTSAYIPDIETHQQIFADHGMNVIGLNEPTGFAAQQGPLSRTLNLIPGINATAGLHDYIFNGSPLLNKYFMYFNIPTMLPAAAFSITAGVGNNALLSNWLINRPQYMSKANNRLLQFPNIYPSKNDIDRIGKETTVGAK